MDGIGDGRLHVAPDRGGEPGMFYRSRAFLAGWRGVRAFEILDTEPLVAFRRLAAAAARTFRVAERQTHLEGEIGAQEIRKIGAVGAIDEAHLVLAEAQMIEQDIALAITQHFM